MVKSSQNFEDNVNDLQESAANNRKHNFFKVNVSPVRASESQGNLLNTISTENSTLERAEDNCI